MMKKIAILICLLLLVACGKKESTGDTTTTLRIYAGAGLRRAMDALAAEFEKETGIACEMDYGGSGMIISRAREDDNADLFIPGDVWYVDRLHELTGNIEEKKTISYFVPTIIVAKGNPKQVKGLKDFARKDLQVALGNPDACQVGRLCAKIFENAGMDSKTFDAKSSLTVNELGVWVKMADVDAAIVWDAIAANVADSVDIIEIPLEQNKISTVVVGLMKTAAHKEAARKFVAFIASPRGQEILTSKGYRVTSPQAVPAK